ncbi:MAG: cyclic pyranopterin monophosphate synthase MoaC [Oscillospiraceae bacterium]|nr:cyclic pyranopterin monophosphate synthase MoaC [Oscillospiraceae bacterium]MBQ8978257.1 cyclic pyranopterin monophosphate synthase MoaC [Oscillospiraceae bacterium]
MLTHIDEMGNAVMVDVTEKDTTCRTARAGGRIFMSAAALDEVTGGTVKKGDVFAAARIAGIMAAKKTPELIPLCHTLLLTSVSIDLYADRENSCVRCECTVRLSGRTGAEMEALTGVSVALLTIYDMCKAIDKTMTVSDICLLEKEGGKSGHYEREKQ